MKATVRLLVQGPLLFSSIDMMLILPLLFFLNVNFDLIHEGL